MPLLVGTSDGLFFLGAPRRQEFPGIEVRCLAFGGGAWWAITERRAIQRRRPGGVWEEVARADGVAALCLAVLGERVLMGTSEAHLLEVRDGRTDRVASFERAPGRAEWFTPWGGSPDTRSMAIDQGGSVFVNVHVGGVLESGDGGRTWRATLPIEHDVHQVAVDPEQPGHVFAATAIGLAVSDNAGADWHTVTRGLHATYQRAVAVGHSHVLVSASRNERGHRSAMYRGARSEPDALVKCERGLPEWLDDNVETHCLDARGEVAAFGTRDGRVFLSIDDGASWHLAADGLPRVTTVRIGL